MGLDHFWQPNVSSINVMSNRQIWHDYGLLISPSSSSIAVHSHLLPASRPLAQWSLCEMLHHVQSAILCVHDKVMVRGY